MKLIPIFAFFSCLLSLPIYTAENNFIVFPGSPMSKTTSLFFTLAEKKQWCNLHCELLNRFSEPDVIDENGYSLLHIIAMNNQAEIAKILINQGHNPALSHTMASTGIVIATPLHYACKEGHLEVAETLITESLKKDILLVNSQTCENNNTPLHLAVWFKKPRIISCLLSYGAKLNAINSEGSTPFHFAAWCNSQESLLELLKSNPTTAIVTAMNNKDNSALDLAIDRSSYETKSVLLSFLGRRLTATEFRNYVDNAKKKHDEIVGLHVLKQVLQAQTLN